MIAPEAPEGPEPPEVDELAKRREERFGREREPVADPLRYACPTCGAHALFRGPCLVCGMDVTQRIDAHGRLIPPADQ